MILSDMYGWTWLFRVSGGATLYKIGEGTGEGDEWWMGG